MLLSNFSSGRTLFPSELIRLNSSAHLSLSSHFSFMCRYVRAESAHLSIYASLYWFLDFYDDFILSISRSAN